MKCCNLFFGIVFFILSSIIYHVDAQVSNGMLADGVLGQTDFVTSTSGLSDSKFNGPSSIAIDPLTRKVFITDRANHRILRFSSTNAYINGGSAEAVIGQSDFVTNTSGLAQNKFNTPIGIFIDTSGVLWVSDYSNNRVLKFNNASNLTNGANADVVLGQPDFVTNTAGATADKMSGPVAVFVDNSGILWVALFNQHRVLRFNDAENKPNGAPADGVLGQPDFTTVSSGLSDIKMNNANGVYIDPQGRLWVSEYTNRRVIRFDNAATKPNGAPADGVLGQPDFITNASLLTAYGSSGTRYVCGDDNGNIYVPHESYNRVVIFLNAANKPNGADADYVLGQADFVSNLSLNPPTQSSLRTPRGVFVDKDSTDLWVADWANNRVLRYNIQSIIPVELTSFTANINSNGVILNWSTATEINNSGFEIQKNVNNSGYKVIGFLNGSGTTTEIKNYLFVDTDLFSGLVAYRLKQIDYNGTYSYSKEVFVNNHAVLSDFKLLNNYPNPFNPSTTISLLVPVKSDIKLDIYNSLGEIVRTLHDGTVNAGINSFYWNGLDNSGHVVSSGIYIYTVKTNNQILSSKMLLQK